MATAHLLHGFLGTGKTTLARRLEVEFLAIRFTPDEWMARVFGEDPPESTYQACERALMDVMEPIWTGCLTRGVDVVLDYGFWRRRERDEVRVRVKLTGSLPRLYRLSCPETEARRRVAARNASPLRTVYIAPETFDQLKARFQPLDGDEEFVAVHAA